MRLISSALTVCAIALALSGCELSRALLFDADDVTSYKRDGAAFHVETTQDATCGGPIRTASPIGSLAGAALNIAESEIDSYLSELKKQFVATYKASLSGKYVFSKQGGYSPAFNCIHILRTIKENGADIPAFDAFFVLKSDSSGVAQRLVPVSVQLARAAAMTDSDSRKVDFEIELEIDAFRAPDADKGALKTIVIDHHFDISGLQTPGGTADKPNKADIIFNCEEFERPKCEKFSDSGWFPAIGKSEFDVKNCTKDPACQGVTPFNVVATVKETGSGGEGFGTIQADIDSSKNNINSAITSYIEQTLSKKK